MFIDGFEANGEEMTGTEAVVRMGKIKDQKVAVRWPTQLPFRNGKQRLDVHKVCMIRSLRNAHSVFTNKVSFFYCVVAVLARSCRSIPNQA